jgi:hypothetical protein
MSGGLLGVSIGRSSYGRRSNQYGLFDIRFRLVRRKCCNVGPRREEPIPHFLRLGVGGNYDQRGCGRCKRRSQG